MKKEKAIYDPDNIVDSFRFEEFQKLLKADKIFDCFGPIKEGSPHEMSILKTWTNHLIAEKQPFAVIRELRKNTGNRTADAPARVPVLTIWKEQFSGSRESVVKRI